MSARTPAHLWPRAHVPALHPKWDRSIRACPPAPPSHQLCRPGKGLLRDAGYGREGRGPQRWALLTSTWVKGEEGEGGGHQAGHTVSGAGDSRARVWTDPHSSRGGTRRPLRGVPRLSWKVTASGEGTAVWARGCA